MTHSPSLNPHLRTSFTAEPAPIRNHTQAGFHAAGRQRIDLADLQVFDLEDFLLLDLPDPEMLLEPILPAAGLMMIYAAPGVGKTLIGVGAALAIATGTSFLRWRAPAPKRVLYIDGEMRGKQFQKRLAAARKISGKAPPRHFNVLNGDVLKIAIPDLASPDGQEALELKIEELGGVEAIVIDNYSSLCRALLENEGDSWQPMQDWLLSLRRRGLSVIIIHHASKGGTARGTSRRLDVLDTVIALKHPEDYSPGEGARFLVEIEKARGFYGADAEPFEAKLETVDGVPRWTIATTIDPMVEQVAAMLRDGCKQRDIAKELEIAQVTVGRYKAKALQLGLTVTPADRFQR